ncbi:hypothetical protein D915_007031 [Fasciola hepatica]|uniref:Uncharacterized protein n=1 Tax=Fasciola hepatica TaxID=6192 RepID=A0A4E0R2K3_FASHE|nr:hypothetical protein D915_007031 [Fasciola hepatica]
MDGAPHKKSAPSIRPPTTVTPKSFQFTPCSDSFHTKMGPKQHKGHRHPQEYNGEKRQQMVTSVRSLKWTASEKAAPIGLANDLSAIHSERQPLGAAISTQFPTRSAESILTGKARETFCLIAHLPRKVPNPLSFPQTLHTSPVQSKLPH